MPLTRLIAFLRIYDVQRIVAVEEDLKVDPQYIVLNLRVSHDSREGISLRYEGAPMSLKARSSLLALHRVLRQILATILMEVSPTPFGAFGFSLSELVQNYTSQCGRCQGTSYLIGQAPVEHSRSRASA